MLPGPPPHDCWQVTFLLRILVDEVSQQLTSQQRAKNRDMMLPILDPCNSVPLLYGVTRLSHNSNVSRCSVT